MGHKKVCSAITVAIDEITTDCTCYDCRDPHEPKYGYVSSRGEKETVVLTNIYTLLRMAPPHVLVTSSSTSEDAAAAPLLAYPVLIAIQLLDIYAPG